MGIMQAELQEKRKWVSKERFLEGLSVANMLPRRDGDPTRHLPGLRARGLVGWTDRGPLLRGPGLRHHARSSLWPTPPWAFTPMRARRSLRAGPGRASASSRCAVYRLGRSFDEHEYLRRPLDSWRRAASTPGLRWGSWPFCSWPAVLDLILFQPGKRWGAGCRPRPRRFVPRCARSGVVAERLGPRLGPDSGRIPDPTQSAGHRSLLSQGREPSRSAVA
mgnify:CR=1 FL=1